MGKFVISNGYLAIGGVDLSNYVKQFTFEIDNNLQDATCMGDLSDKDLAGITKWSITVDSLQDFASAKVDATLWAMVGAASASTVAIRAVNTTIGATNPEYQGNVMLEKYTPITGSPGDVAKAPYSLKGNSAITRDVTP